MPNQTENVFHILRPGGVKKFVPPLLIKLNLSDFLIRGGINTRQTQKNRS